MKTAKELELSILLKEKTIQDLKFRIYRAIHFIYSHCNCDTDYIIEFSDIKILLDILQGCDE